MDIIGQRPAGFGGVALAAIMGIAGCGNDASSGNGEQQTLSAVDGSVRDSGLAAPCVSRSLNECEESNDCVLQAAVQIDPTNKCARAEKKPAACVQRDALCRDSETCRFDTKQQVLWLFGSWCIKDEYTETLVAPESDTSCQTDPLIPVCT